MAIKDNFFYRSLHRNSFIWLALTVGLAAGVRLFNLDLLEPFIDESSHIYFFDQFSFYKKLSLGAKVLGFVIFYNTTRWAPDPLQASRLLVASIGVATTAGIFLTTYRLGGSVAAVVAGVIWALQPFIVFHDRLALHDPLISFFLIWAAFFLIESLRQEKWLLGLLSGLLLGLAIATKPTALIGGLWLLLLVSIYMDWPKLKLYSRLLIAFAAGLTLPLSVIGLSLVPYFNDFLQYADHFVTPASENLTRWRLFLINTERVWNWIDGYNSIYFGMVSLLSLVLALLQPSRLKLALLAAFLISVATQAFLFQVWFARYLIPTLIPLTILIGLVSAEWLIRTTKVWSQKEAEENKWITSAITGLLFSLLALAMPFWISTHLTLQTAPREANIPSDDQFQYFHGWPSGTGLTEVVSFLEVVAQESEDKIVVITGTFGRHGYWSIPMIMKEKSNIEFRHLESGTREEFIDILAGATKRKTLVLEEPPKYIIPYEIVTLITPFPALIFEYNRPHAEGGFQIYELDPRSHLKSTVNETGLPAD